MDIFVHSENYTRKDILKLLSVAPHPLLGNLCAQEWNLEGRRTPVPLLHAEEIISGDCDKDVERDISPDDAVVAPPLAPEDSGSREILIRN